MNTKMLIQFVGVANAGNISEASKRLNIAQPALSYAIAALEKDLNVKLFERHRRGVNLTDEGKVLLHRAESILNQLEAARNAVRETADNPSGRVSIALPASVSHVIAEPLCRRIIDEYPLINLHLEEGLTGNLLQAMRAGSLGAIIDFDAAQASELNVEPLLKEDLYLVGRNLKSTSPINFTDLVNYTLFLPGRDHGMGRAIAKYETDSNITLKRSSIRAAVHPMLKLLHSGVGYSIAPWSLIYDRISPDGLNARKIINPNLFRTAYLVHPRLNRLSLASRIVFDILKEEIVAAHQNNLWLGELLMDEINE